MNSLLAEAAARPRLPHRRQSEAAGCQEPLVETTQLESPLSAARSLWSSTNPLAENHAVRQDDMLKALALPPYWEDAHGSVYILPDAPWGHRCANSLNALLARLQPERANAVLRPNGAEDYEAKIQACARATMAPRARRWVIDRLPEAEVDHFIQAFSACRWGALRSPVFRAWQ